MPINSSILQRFNTSPTAKQYLILFFLLLFALCYYGSYYRCSLYPASEGGIEGVVALRLMEGKVPFLETALNYNLFWFYPIVALFKIFGPSYTTLRIFFFFLATLTSLLSFYAVRLTTRNLGVATLAGLLTLILPGQLFRNYMAFLVMLNMALFLKAFLSSHSTPQKNLLWVAAAGFALSLTFLIRVDLGFFLSLIFVPLAVIFPWISCHRKESLALFTHRLLLSLSALLLGIFGFFALHFPVYLHAQHRGFGPYFIAQYEQYPHMIISQGSRLFKKMLPASHVASPNTQVSQNSRSGSPLSYSTSSSPSNTTKTPLLRRSLFSTDLREKITALNLYLPTIISLLLLFMSIGFFFQRETNSSQRAYQLLTSLGCSLTLFPQYFFWRPDMVHLSEFMVPMTVTIIIALFFSWKNWPASKIFSKIILSLFVFFGITTLSLYFINGCQSQSTGGI
ncbi:MAG: hypothetical protein FJ390_00965, partial [Verrucomicrobia bacterium]|nr:hypothetical protein [Verrucomicrobiota bacterium]